MNAKLTHRSICGLMLAGWSAVAGALSLGPATGTAVVGRPLELVAPIQFDDPAQGKGSGCVSAQVMYGDRILDRDRVRVELGGDDAGRGSHVLVTVDRPVDEPFVTVVMQAGCGRQSSRRYVLLAEAPTERPIALAAASALGAASRAHSRSVPSMRSVRTTQIAGAPPAVRPTPSRRLTTASREPVPSSRGRLQLAVWDPGSEQLSWLRTSTELNSSPTADAARRAAAASLWRALNAQPQDLLRTAERLRGLEGEMSTLRNLSARHRAEISSARDALKDAQNQRHTSLLVVTLLALLAGGSAAVVLHRIRRPTRATAADSWYGPLEPLDEHDVVLEEETMPPVVELPLEVVPVEAIERPVPARAPPLAPFIVPLPVVPVQPVAVVPVAVAPGLKVEALLGAQQQSEFFASLGQVDEAVAVLTAYLQESSERPVLAFLELFHIYDATGMRAEFEELQSTFRKTFGMDVASAGETRDEQRELALYLGPVNRIASAWPTERSLEIIEESLFKRPAGPGDLLSLEAYRELLWLYSLGQDIVHDTSSPTGIQLAGNQGLPNGDFTAPWDINDAVAEGELSLDRLARIDVAAGINAFAVDIDLTALRSDEQPAPEVVKPTQAAPTSAPDSTSADLEAFDAVMESVSRRQSR